MVIAPFLKGMDVSALSLKQIDRMLLSLELRLARRRGKLDASASSEECVHVMQRKQNLGMNAILSVSLAMARGAAHLRGQNLYEILREEIIAIIARLANTYSVQIRGGQFADYVEALRAVNKILTESGKSLYETLRNDTQIYDELKIESDELNRQPAPLEVETVQANRSEQGEQG
jgi:hypothetical protein